MQTTLPFLNCAQHFLDVVGTIVLDDNFIVLASKLQARILKQKLRMLFRRSREESSRCLIRDASGRQRSGLEKEVAKMAKLKDY